MLSYKNEDGRLIGDKIDIPSRWKLHSEMQNEATLDLTESDDDWIIRGQQENVKPPTQKEVNKTFQK